MRLESREELGKQFASPIVMDPGRPHEIPPPDDDLVRRCRDEAAAARDHWMSNGAQVDDAPDRAETVVALADEVLRLRAENARLLAQVAAASANTRDTFAAAALQGMCANPMGLNRANMDGCDARLSRDAYWLADAMLKAREGKP